MSSLARRPYFRSLAAFSLFAVSCGNSKEDIAPSNGDERAECFPGPHEEEEPDAPPHTPRWAFEPWLSKDYSSAADTMAFAQGSLDHGIPLGAVVLDSPWETDYNTFEFDPNPGRYTDAENFIRELGDKGVRVVVWMTPLMNSSSFDLEKQATTLYDSPGPDYELAEKCGFFVNEGEGYFWWKGRGAGVDFFNPSAVAWWHTLQDRALDLGIAGFKLDFGDSYIRTDTIQTAIGEIPHQEWSEAYYRDFYRHGRVRRGKDFVTMVRGWDESYDLPGRFFARPEHASVVWAGDNRRDYVGLIDALDTTFRSAVAGYVVVGSDLGGYLDRDDKDLLGPKIPFDSLVFARWTAMSALMPFMQMHGRDDLMPWTVPEDTEETLTLYRYWASLHHALVPFFYSLAEETYAKRKDGIVRPLTNEPSGWEGDFRYRLGDAFLVAPIFDETGIRDIPLPAGARYYDWWTPEEDALEGGTTLIDYNATARERLPLFVREGAIVPLNLDADVVFKEGSLVKDHLTVFVWPGETKSAFVLHDEDDAQTKIDAQTVGTRRAVSLERALRPTVLRVRSDAAPSSVEVNGKAVAARASFAALAGGAEGYWYEAATRSTWVAIAPSSERVEVDVRGE
jgi:alpha-glucosidase (family GH31 glycosyl hydrolase)